MKFEKIIDGLTDEIEFMIGMGTAPLVQEAARRELQAQQQEIAELKAMVNEFIEEFSCFVAQHECNCGHPSCRTCRECRDAFKLLDKTPAQCLQSVKADAVKEFGHEIGLYDSEYDDQEYIEVSRYSLREHIEQLREGKS